MEKIRGEEGGSMKRGRIEGERDWKEVDKDS